MSSSVRRHPFLGLIAGLLIGLGAVLLLFVLGVVPVSVVWVAGCVGGGAVLGMVAAFVTPARS